MTIRELAEAMKMQPSVIVKKLFMQGMMVTVNHEIDFEKAQEIALEYDIIAEPEEKIDVIEELLKEDEEALHHISCDALCAQTNGNRACGGNDNEGF